MKRIGTTKLVGVQVYLLSSKKMCGWLSLVLQNPKISPTPYLPYCLLVWFLIFYPISEIIHLTERESLRGLLLQPVEVRMRKFICRECGEQVVHLLAFKKAKKSRESEVRVPQFPLQEGTQDLNLPLGPVTPHSTNLGRKPLTQGPLCNILD